MTVAPELHALQPGNGPPARGAAASGPHLGLAAAASLEREMRVLAELQENESLPSFPELLRQRMRSQMNASTGVNASLWADPFSFSADLSALFNRTAPKARGRIHQHPPLPFLRPVGHRPVFRINRARQLGGVEATTRLLDANAPGAILRLATGRNSTGWPSQSPGGIWANRTNQTNQLRGTKLPAGAVALGTFDNYDGESAAPQAGGPTACDQKNLDVLFERVVSQVTMCCQKQQCYDTPGWTTWGFSCNDLEKWGMCAQGAYTHRFKYMYKDAPMWNYPEQHCCACGKSECKGEGNECGITESLYCAELANLGLGECTLNCKHMWELSCLRWTRLHNHRCPMCDQMTYIYEVLPDGRHEDKIDNPTPRGAAEPAAFSIPCLNRKKEGRLGYYGRFTPWNDWGGNNGGGNLIFLDRHWPYCHDSPGHSYVLNGFWIIGWGVLSVYYRCVEVCMAQDMQVTWHVTPLYDDGQWLFQYYPGYSNTFFLLLHHVKCPVGSVLKGWHLDRGGTATQVQLIYACQKVEQNSPSQCGGGGGRRAMTLHRRSTPWQHWFHGMMYSLIYHSPACNMGTGYSHGQGMRGFNLHVAYHGQHIMQQIRYECVDLEPGGTNGVPLIDTIYESFS